MDLLFPLPADPRSAEINICLVRQQRKICENVISMVNLSAQNFVANKPCCTTVPCRFLTKRERALLIIENRRLFLEIPEA